ncbi:Hsp20/alpha crystallin family protein [Aliikangiella marina]|uniref:Hsp20/alpha crystallin family protein n=1 Tax=Aliikangiella marina TaxID=1712262 RepID=A0A545T963_9GAMM|nr:Hsp20/alpha crystallin family protein [Aliikangiella marina]TQV73728.1 Hsp20/alpha crystallin family protein [Aliikangiella marina]
MNMLRINPFKELDSFFDVQRRALADRDASFSKDWSPRVDIVESDESFVIKAELAGIPKEDIKVEVDNKILTLSGERKSEVTDEKHHRVERFYGSFSRSFSLPETIDEANIKAESKDGILTLTLPKQAPQETLKKIEIH